MKLQDLIDRTRCYLHGGFVDGDELADIRDQLILATNRVNTLTAERDMARHDTKVWMEVAVNRFREVTAANEALLAEQERSVVLEAELHTKKAAEG